MAALSPSADDARMLVDLAALLTETVATVNALEVPPVPVVAAYALPLLSRTPRADRFFDFPREDRHKIWSSVIEANLNLREDIFQRRFRFPKSLFARTVEQIHGSSEFCTRRMTAAIAVPVALQLMITLHRYAHNLQIGAIACEFHVAEGTVEKCFNRCVRALHGRYFPSIFQWASPLSAPDTCNDYLSAGFEALSGIIGCLSAGDCKHHYQKETGDFSEDSFTNRHHTKSVNCFVSFKVFRGA